MAYFSTPSLGRIQRSILSHYAKNKIGFSEKNLPAVEQAFHVHPSSLYLTAFLKMMKVLLPKIVRNKFKKLFTTQNVVPAAVRSPVAELPQVDNVVLTNAKIKEKTNGIELNSGDQRRSSRKYISAESKKNLNQKKIRPSKSDILRSFEKTDEWKLLNATDKKLIKSILENQFLRSGSATVRRRLDMTNKEIRYTPAQSVSAVRRSSNYTSAVSVVRRPSNYTSRRNSYVRMSIRRPPFRTVPKFNQISELTLPY